MVGVCLRVRVDLGLEFLVAVQMAVEMLCKLICVAEGLLADDALVYGF